LHAAEAAVIQAQQQKLQAEALLRQRRSELVTARVDFERVSQLADNGFSSQARLEGQRTVLDTAKAAVAAAEASVERLQALIDDATLTAPGAGRVQYILAQEGEILGSGGRVASITDLSDMYMSIFLPTRDATRLAVGDEARIILDAIPDYVIPATVTFGASTAQFTPRSVETEDEREQFMFRVNLRIAPDLLAEYQKHARAGVPGMGYVRVNESVDWSEELVVKLPQ